ncbi:hypothetical protein BH160DRAFT_6527 [Burkholderia sp. H160]|nr:hypothetical protein BH160DRAFT_6527 [Burkholderia sp. H160]
MAARTRIVVGSADRSRSWREQSDAQIVLLKQTPKLAAKLLSRLFDV